MKGGELVFSARYCGASPKRLDEFVSDITSFTRSRARNLILDGCVTVCDKEVVKAGYMIRGGDNITVIAPPPKKLDLSPSDHKVPIVYQDEDIAIVDKPQGMVVHQAGSYRKNDTLVNALMSRMGGSLSGINGVIRPGIVHRLDKDTSGLIVVAKNDEAHRSLAAQIKEKTARRIYIGLVDGNIKQDSGTVDAPIARSRRDRKKMAVAEGGRRAVTHYTVLKRYGAYTLVRFELETGRTHQIRVHAAYIHHPIVGDPLYGGSTRLYSGGQLLHAAELHLDDPATGERRVFTSDLPPYFAEVLRTITPCLY